MQNSNKIPKCHHCQSDMATAKIVEKNMGLQVLGLIIALAGFCLLFIIPIGTLVGLLFLIGGARMGYKKSPGWKCPGCGYSFTTK